MTVHTRDEWADGRAIVGIDHESRALDSVEAFVVHSTSGRTLGDVDAAQWLRNLYDAHVARGYADIAYEYAVDWSGDVWECRPLSLWSAAQRGHNPTSIAVVVLEPTVVELGKQEDGLRHAYELACIATRRRLLQRTHSDFARGIQCPGSLRSWVHAGGLTSPPADANQPLIVEVPPVVEPVPLPKPPPVYEELVRAGLPEVPAAGISPTVISRIRTVVPALVGVLLTWLQRRYGIVVHLDPSWLAVLVVIVTGLYYDLVRRLEAWKPELGWLLGYPSPPTYEKAA